MIVHDHDQGTPEWHAARLGVPSGSKASCLVSYEGKPTKAETWKKYADKLASDIFAGEDTEGWEGNRYTEAGSESEPEARAWYAFTRDVDVREVGFVTNDSGRYGASPDGLIGERHGGAEFKCLPKQHTAALLYHARHDRPQPTYVPQVHMEMLACELEWNDLVYYHAQLPKLVIRIYRDDAFLKVLLEQIKRCIERREETLAILRKIEEAA